LAEYKVLTEVNSGRGSLWNDRVVEHVGLDEPHGDYLVYIAEDQNTAERARVLDAHGDDDQLGELLAVPGCCRAFYSCSIRDHILEDPLWIVAEQCQTPWDIPQGANVCAQYFERGFLSHFPCDLGCPQSRLEAKRRFTEIGQLCEQFAEWLAEGCKWSYLILRQGIAAMMAQPARCGSYRVTKFIGTRGAVPSWILQREFLSIRNGHLERPSALQGEARMVDEAIMIIASEEW